MKRAVVALILLASIWTTHLAPPPRSLNFAGIPTPAPQQGPRDQVEAAIRQAITAQRENVLAFLVFDIQIPKIELSSDQTWATAFLVSADPQTGFVIPGEPQLALARWEAGEWRAILPSSPDWERYVREAPSELLSDQARADWLNMYASQTQAPETEQTLGGYHLPWAGGTSKVLTRSITHYDPPNPDGDMHHAFDFAAPWDSTGTSPMFDVYAAKGGVVKWVVWWNANGDKQHANYLVLEDTTTNPTTYQLYLHLAYDSIPPELRQPGAVVHQGQYIAMADDNGASWGNHLHFQVHTNPYSYWGKSVDITFSEVSINYDAATQGGRPRTSYEASHYPQYGSESQYSYLSSNTVHGDFTPPSGDLLEPAGNGTVLTSPSLHLEGWATDEDSGLASAQFIADYGSGWQPVGSPFSTSSFSLDWDLCASQVPDGPVSVALQLQDQAGNWSSNLPGLRHFLKEYACPAVPTCSPDSQQVALYADPDYRGSCLLLGSGSYTTTASLGALGAKNAASIRLGADVQATLYANVNLTGRGETFAKDDSDLSDNRIGADSLSSLLVQPRSAQPAIPRPIWPTSTFSDTNDASLTLAWDNAGASTLFQARLISPTETITSAWLSEIDWGLGSLSPGSYAWQVRGSSAVNTSAWSPAFSLKIRPVLSSTSPISFTAPFTDDMESGSSSWTASGLWFLDGQSNHTKGGSLAWRYAGSASQTYETGLPNEGSLTSPSIQIPSAGYFLRFWYTTDTESSGVHWDQRWVQISVEGKPFANLLQLSDDPASTWLQSPAIDLSAYAGKRVRLRFYFDTLDEAANQYRGWTVDDVSILASPPPDCADTNNSPAKATAITYGSAAKGVICPGGDIDFFRFTGKSGDQVGAAVEAQSAGSDLDSYLTLLDSDGASILAENDDQALYVRTDSFLSYRLPHDGSYYLKLKAWNHPSGGDEQATYTLKLYHDQIPPQASLLSPSGGIFLPAAPLTITAAITDSQSGPSHVEFLWHSGDWKNTGWTLLGVDWDGKDGWGYAFDPSTLSDQKDAALLVRAYDWAGNLRQAAIWDLSVDHTPPVTAIQPLPASQNNTAILVQWSASDNLSGLAAYDIERSQDGKAWKLWFSHLAPDVLQAWFMVEPGHTYGFRMRGVDQQGNAEAYPDSAEATIQVPASLCDAQDVWENDNDPAVLTPITTSLTIQEHNFCNPENASTHQYDEDWLAFALQSGQELAVQSLPQTASAAANLELYSAPAITSTLLAQGLAGDYEQTSQLAWLAKKTAVVYLRARPLDGRIAGSDVKYLLEARKGYPIFLPFTSVP